MAARAFWKGYLRLSLVSCPVQLFPATSEREKVRFHQLSRRTGNRIRHCKRDAVTGEEVDADDVVMAYEVHKGQYVDVADEELEAVAIERTHTIDIDQFVPRREIDDLYLSKPYYIVPDGDIGRQAYAVIRAAIDREALVALGRVIFTTREHVVAIEPRQKGLMGVTLRYPYEVRPEELYLGDLPDERVPKEMLDLALHIVASKTGHFDPHKFEDRYEKAMRDLIARKERGEKIEKPREPASANVINLMDALRQSVAAERRSRPRARTDRRRARAKRSSAGARKAG